MRCRYFSAQLEHHQLVGVWSEHSRNYKTQKFPLRRESERISVKFAPAKISHYTVAISIQLPSNWPRAPQPPLRLISCILIVNQKIKNALFPFGA